MKYKISFYVILIILSVSSLNAQVTLTCVDDAVNVALQNSQDYIYQGLNAVLAMETSNKSFRDFLPTLDFSYSNNTTVNKNATDSLSKTLTVSFSELLFDGGQRKYSYDMSKISSLYSYSQYEQNLRSFSSAIMEQYYLYLKQKEIVLIQEELLKNATEQLEIIEKEVQLGISLETDYLEYLISYLDIEKQKDTSIRELERNERTFKISLGLDKNAELIITEKMSNDNAYITLDEYIDFLYERACNNSIEIKQQALSLESSKKTLDFSKKWYLPNINFSGSVSFSGRDFPLTEPKYSLQLSFSFSRNPYFPLQLSTNASIDDSLNGTGSSASSQVFPSSTVQQEKKSAQLSLLQQELQSKNAETQLYEGIVDAIYQHDDCIHEIEMITKTLELQERKLEFSEMKLQTGELKHIDYLDELTQIANTRMELLDAKATAEKLERELEIYTQIPFGELLNVCSLQK